MSWHPLRSPNTKPYEEWLLRMLINATVADVASKLGITEAVVTGSLERWVAASLEWDEFESLGGLGIDLKPIEQQVLARLFEDSARLQQAYQLREALMQIFERDDSKRGAKCAIRAWCQRVEKSRIRAFDSFLTTVENWLDEIANYCLELWTSGFVEGFNNRVKVMKRRCYGIFDVEQLFERLSLELNG